MPSLSYNGLVAEAEWTYEHLLWRDADRVSGAVCFYGTRVPVQALFDYIEGGDSIDQFLASFPSVAREQAVAVVNLSRDAFLKLVGLAAQCESSSTKLCQLNSAANFKGTTAGRCIKMGWAALHNGELIQHVRQEFDAFVTLDRGILHQQNHKGHSLIIAVLRVANSRVPTVLASAPVLLEFLSRAQPGQIEELKTMTG